MSDIFDVKEAVETVKNDDFKKSLSDFDSTKENTEQNSEEDNSEQAESEVENKPSKKTVKKDTNQPPKLNLESEDTVDEDSNTEEGENDTSDEEVAEDNPKELARFEKEITKLKDDLSKSNSWGHEKNRTLVKGMKNLQAKIQHLVDENMIFEEEGKALLESFDLDKIGDENESQEDTPVKTLNDLDKKLTDELKNFKKYNKSEGIDEAYNGFFNNLSFYTPEERAEVLEYIKTADPADALTYILSEGHVINEHLASPIEEHGSVVNYITSLKNEINKLNSKLKSTKEKIKKNSQSEYTMPKKEEGSIFDRQSFFDNR